MGNEIDELDKELPEFDGQRPDEQVGPDQCEADAKRVEKLPGEGSEGVEASEFEPGDELHEQFPIEEIAVVPDPVDGLPTPMTGDFRTATAPAFTYDNVVCLEDDREYVELFAEEMSHRGWRGVSRGPTAEDVRWCPESVFDLRIIEEAELAIIARSRFEPDGSEATRRTFEPDSVERMWGTTLVLADEGDGFIPVRPRRDRCKHYKRQVFSNDDQPDPTQEGHQIVFRNCTARRSNGGAFMSLRDEAVYMCDYRDPPDERSAQEQDGKDRDKLVNRPDLLQVPLFGTEGEAVQLEDKS